VVVSSKLRLLILCVMRGRPSVEIKALGHVIVKSLVEVERMLRRFDSVSSS